MGMLLRLSGYALRYKWQLTLAYICLTGSTLLSLAVPWILRLAIDSSLENGQTSDLVWLATLTLFVSVVRGGFSYGQSYMGEYVSQHVAHDLRHDFMARMHALSFGFHDHRKTGDTMSRATEDVESVRWFVSFGLIQSLYILILVGGVAGLLLVTKWDLALIALAAVPIASYIAIRTSRRFRRLWKEVQVETGRMTTLLHENLSGMRVVKTFGAEEYEKGKFRGAAERVAENTFTVNRLHAANSSFLSLLFAIVTGLVIWFGGRQIIDLGMTPGELTQFILYLGLLVFPIRISGWVVNVFSRAISAGERILQVLDAQSPVQEKEGAIDLERVRGEVKFESVRFSYGYNNSQTALSSPSADVIEEPEGEGKHSDGAQAPPKGNGPWMLRNINLEAAPGEKIAILGTPGSGKSTLVNLIPRFYDVTEGVLAIDGVDVRDASLESLRRNVGIVMQDAFLFGATIHENISYGAPEATLLDIESAAKLANIHDFIMELPDQYETLVGERGVTLSGGQRQRVAIARTILLDPPILILDDATSSVDAETESLIQMSFDRVMRSRTTFIIAHRVSSVRKADLILVLKDGEIVERGTHQELITREGLYREIYHLQLHTEEDVLLEPRASDIR